MVPRASAVVRGMLVRRAQLSMFRTSLEKCTWAVEEGGDCMVGVSAGWR